MKQLIKDLETEDSELKVRIERLKKFYNKVANEYNTIGHVTSVSDDQCTLFLGMQLNAMEDYEYYLSERIKNLKLYDD
jgi:archaellum component FlaC